MRHAIATGRYCSMSNHIVSYSHIMGADPRCSTIERKYRWVLLLLAIILFPFLAQPVYAQSSAPTDSISQEVYLNFNYSFGLVNTVVTALYVEPAMYLPMGEIFNLLKINHEFDSKLDSMWGFYITEHCKYKINFRTKKARVDTSTFILNSSEFIRSTFDVYVIPSVLERLFGVRFIVDMARLTLSLETNEELPIIAERNRERQQKMIESSNAAQADYPLLYPRNKNLFDGGFLDYSLAAASTKKNRSYGYTLQGSGIVAGGDLELTANGNYAASMPPSTKLEGRWRYVIDKSRYVSNIIAGYMYTNGLFPRSFKGIQASNEPVQVRTMFQSYVIEQKTYPQWTVELYLDEKLIGVTKADGLGNYRFVIPLTYGTTNYSLRIYGPTGEIIEDRQRIQIPFSFIPVGEINYIVSGGTLRGNNDQFVQASVITGLTSWLTARAGMEFIDDTLSAKPIGSLSLSSWLKKNYIFTIDAAPGALYRADLSAVYASQVSADISVTKHEKNEYYNPSHIMTEAQTTLSLPLMLASLPITYRLQANRRNYETNSSVFITTGGTASYKDINGTIEYRYSEISSNYYGTTREPVISTSILYSYNPRKKLASLTKSILLGSSFIYNLERKKADELRFDISSNITPSGRIQFSYTRNFVQNKYIASMQFVYDFPSTRSTTTASIDAGDATVIQNVRGTIGYDSHQESFHYNNLESVGLSALTMRMFVDKNGNEVFDSGEQTINDVAFNLGQAAIIDLGDSGITRVRRLLPYTRYNIDIFESSILNPLWKPKSAAFSVITEPNIYKPIDVPFYASGVLEGSVFMQIGSNQEAVPGIEIHVQSIDRKYRKDIRIFADGSFYEMGVPPGKYFAYVDSAQLGILGASCDPPIRSFDVKITTDGDYIEGLAFVLKKQIAEKPVSIMRDSVKDQNVLTIVSSREKYQILNHEKPKGYIIHISTWDTERRARNEAKKFERDMEIKTFVEKIIVSGKSKYAVRLGIFPSKEEAFTILRKLHVNE
jgi:hypothetical protein